LVVFPHVKVYEGISEEAYQPGEMLWETGAVDGEAESWMEVAFGTGVQSRTGFYYVVFEWPFGVPFVGRGHGGGPGLGYVIGAPGSLGFIVKDGRELAKLQGQAAVYMVEAEGGNPSRRTPASGGGAQFVGPARLSAWPNPTRDSAELHYVLPRAGVHDLAVFDIRGRLVRTIKRESAEAGSHTLRWDGRDDGGRDVPAGVYFARLIAGRETRSERIVLFR
jgi:hypothetical protein